MDCEAKALVDEIIEDLTGRVGFSSLWDRITIYAKNDIRATLETIAAKYLERVCEERSESDALERDLEIAATFEIAED